MDGFGHYCGAVTDTDASQREGSGFSSVWSLHALPCLLGFQLSGEKHAVWVNR